ncbi:hypothetical protein [Roseovarius indicus]|uniref:Uncharacterized protein n=1 Tax=Roseovarius indicus TaxID=540747 RepID=A0A0T5P4K8_9RHOB|nr:hypothetical protein [Roseovarius indicus]KRS16059.1 hypothetical protein XM52_21080 [Roseovarius indicus]QEW28064.1 hypothetical protein RIdsm_03889 [Roseovarius indicus]SFE60856.1 hypothetical protein SAMN04488031_113138 [Roseovarius indicus]
MSETERLNDEIKELKRIVTRHDRVIFLAYAIFALAIGGGLFGAHVFNSYKQALEDRKTEYETAASESLARIQEVQNKAMAGLETTPLLSKEYVMEQINAMGIADEITNKTQEKLTAIEKRVDALSSTLADLPLSERPQVAGKNPSYDRIRTRNLIIEDPEGNALIEMTSWDGIPKLVFQNSQRQKLIEFIGKDGQPRVFLFKPSGAVEGSEEDDVRMELGYSTSMGTTDIAGPYIYMFDDNNDKILGLWATADSSALAHYEDGQIVLQHRAEYVDGKFVGNNHWEKELEENE